MDDAARLERDRLAKASEHPAAADNEAAEVARLLARAGIDHASALWFQLLELATQQAGEWAERAAASAAPLTARAAAILGLRSLAAAILSNAQDQDAWTAESAAAAAEACLRICAETETAGEPRRSPPPRRRRWGEGALPRRAAKPRLLQLTAGCC